MPARTRLLGLRVALLMIGAPAGALQVHVTGHGGTSLLARAVRARAPPALAQTSAVESEAPSDPPALAQTSAVESEAPPGSGRLHTEESKRKISLANKGRVPWNVGKKHSEETKRKIAERTRAAMVRRREAKLAAMQRDDPEGYAQMLASQQAAEQRKEERLLQRAAAAQRREQRAARAEARASRAASSEPAVNGSRFTDDVRARISEGLRARWRDPEYRASRNYTTSEETRRKLSLAMKAKWANGEFRRASMGNGSHSEERRLKIAASVKAKWADPAYRNKTEIGRAHV